MGIRVIHRDEVAPSLPMISSDARLLAWPGVGALVANMNWVTMQPGEANRPHAHNDSDDTIYIVSGRGSVEDVGAGRILQFEARDVIHVPAGIVHAVKADRGVPVTSVGGPCPPDAAMLRAAGLITGRRPGARSDRR